MSCADDESIRSDMMKGTGSALLRATRNLGLLVAEHNARLAFYFGEAANIAWGKKPGSPFPDPMYLETEPWDPKNPQNLPGCCMEFCDSHAPFGVRFNIDQDFQECFIDLFRKGDILAQDIHPSSFDLSSPRTLGAFVRKQFDEIMKEIQECEEHPGPGAS